MQFVYNKVDIPGLSWLAVVEKDNEEVTVFHGNYVECKPNWFAAGVWDGEFGLGDFDKCHFSCCSGGKIADYQNAAGGGYYLLLHSMSPNNFFHIITETD